MDELNLENVLCIPDLQHNLISVWMLNMSRHCIIFKNDKTVNINDIDNNSITTKIGHMIGNLFHLSTDEAYLANRTFDKYALWYY